MLETSRLLLRKPEVKDFEDYHHTVGSPPIRLGPDAVPSREESYKRLLSNIGCWTSFGFGTFIVSQRTSSRIVGACGIFMMERDVEPRLDGSPEAGWSIGVEYRGLSYALESMTAVLSWFDDVIGIRRSVCMIDVGNTASERLAAKLGYEPITTGRYQDVDVINYAREPD